MDRLSSSVWSKIISKSQEEDEYESLQESDDEVFKPPKCNKKTSAKKEVKEKANILSEKKVDNFLINLRKFEQTLPTNECSFKERAKSDILIKNSCTISYFLFSLWLTCQIDKGFLKEIELVGGIYEIISKIIKLIDSSSWAKAKHCWLVECLKKSPSIQEEKRVTFDCFGK